MPQQLQSLLLTMPQLKALEHRPDPEAEIDEPGEVLRVLRSSAS
jgi:hypothetical protein